MTRDEWYKTPEFFKTRLLNNLVHDVKQLTQRVYDVLNVLNAEFGELMLHDKFSLLERQLRITDIEAANLIRVCTDAERLLERLLKHKLGVQDD